MAHKIFNGGEYLVQDINHGMCLPGESHRQTCRPSSSWLATSCWTRGDRGQEFRAGGRNLKARRTGADDDRRTEQYGGLELDKATRMLVMELPVCPKLRLELYGPYRHRHAAVHLLRHRRAEEALPGQADPGENDRRLLPDRAGLRSDAPWGRKRRRRSPGTAVTVPEPHQAVPVPMPASADLFNCQGRQGPLYPFPVERTSVGLSSARKKKKTGMHRSSTRQVILNVRVPVENVLGETARGTRSPSTS